LWGQIEDVFRGSVVVVDVARVEDDAKSGPKKGVCVLCMGGWLDSRLWKRVLIWACNFGCGTMPITWNGVGFGRKNNVEVSPQIGETSLTCATVGEGVPGLFNQRETRLWHHGSDDRGRLTEDQN
jgi:hypothetical protein